MVRVNDLDAKVIGLSEAEYADGNPALQASLEFDDGWKEKVLISVNVPDDFRVELRTFCIKNYSEGEALYNSLVGAGWLEETGATVQSGFVTMPVCRITEKAVMI